MSKLDLLRGDTVYHALITLLRERYEGLGRVGGSVSLKAFSPGEIEKIAGLTGIPVEMLEAKKSLTLKKFEQSIAHSTFAYESLPAFLEDYYGQKIMAKREQQALAKAAEASFLQEIITKHPMLQWYIEWIAEKPQDARLFWLLYKEDTDVLKQYVGQLEDAFALLIQDDTLIRLPLFAQQVTGNPHAMDRQEPLGKLLIHLLTVQRYLQDTTFELPKSAEEEAGLLEFFGLLKDDLWSFITCRNLLAEQEGNNVHLVWEAAVATKTTLNVPVKELVNIVRLYPTTGTRVYVVENSSVASTLMDLHPDAPIICTHGQIRTAGWKALALLAQQSAVTIFYSGDLDPEGILIADKIYERFPRQVRFWRMDEQTYINNLSEEQLPVASMSKLVRVNHPNLQRLAVIMKERKLAAYQESFLGELARDMG